MNLKTVSIKLFGCYQHLGTASAGIGPGQKAFTQESEMCEEYTYDQAEDTYILTKKRPVRNKPGMEQMAIKKTGTQMNHPDDVMMGKGLRLFRCGKGDRMLKDCPLPYTAALAFAPKKGKPSSQKAPKSIFPGWRRRRVHWRNRFSKPSADNSIDWRFR